MRIAQKLLQAPDFHALGLPEYENLHETHKILLGRALDILGSYTWSAHDRHVVSPFPRAQPTRGRRIFVDMIWCFYFLQPSRSTAQEWLPKAVQSPAGPQRESYRSKSPIRSHSHDICEDVSTEDAPRRPRGGGERCVGPEAGLQTGELRGAQLNS